jgi:hypothetical protein
VYRQGNADDESGGRGLSLRALHGEPAVRAAEPSPASPHEAFFFSTSGGRVREGMVVVSPGPVSGLRRLLVRSSFQKLYNSGDMAFLE